MAADFMMGRCFAQGVEVRGRRLPVRPTSNNSVKRAGDLLISIGEQSTGFPETHDTVQEDGVPEVEHEVQRNTQRRAGARSQNAVRR